VTNDDGGNVTPMYCVCVRGTERQFGDVAETVCDDERSPAAADNLSMLHIDNLLTVRLTHAVAFS